MSEILRLSASQLVPDPRTEGPGSTGGTEGDERPDVVVDLDGEVDLSNAARVAEFVSSAARDGHDVVVDLTRLQFIDMPGLNALVDAQRVSRRAGGRLVVRHAPPHVQRLLAITGLDTVLDCR